MDKGAFVSRAEPESTTLKEILERLLEEVTPATVKRDLVLLGHVFEVARKELGIYAHNPVHDIKLPAGGRPRDRRLQPGEEALLFAACREARNGWLLPIVQLGLETAMRQGELRRLRWEHIDLNHRTAHLPDTKNGEARTVPLSTTAVNVLRDLPRGLRGDVFPGITTEAVKRFYMRAIRRAGSRVSVSTICATRPPPGCSRKG
ncbi:MAG: site-specific integrase [Sedimenticolaceae bacterium]